MASIYDFKMKDIDGNEVDFQKYKGKVLLIVNTATKCGFTPQFDGLEKLYEKYKDKGFEVLGFPCNQFFHQAPGNEAEIKEFCSLRYNVKFTQFSKIDVNGKNQHPLYAFLKEQCGNGKNIKWNFVKFLVDKNGNVLKRFAPTDKPESLEEDIESILN